VSAEQFLCQAVELARANVRNGGRPFGALVVKDGVVIGRGVNEVVATNDPTAHADLQAIRAASQALGTPRLDGCVMYVSGHPCPMCLAAAYLSGIGEVFYAYSLQDAEPYGLSTAALYSEMAKPLNARSVKITQVPVTEEESPYEMWRARA
jgi:tRNA(Arg) A34 adenosine deaminase TadA